MGEGSSIPGSELPCGCGRASACVGCRLHEVSADPLGGLGLGQEAGPPVQVMHKLPGGVRSGPLFRPRWVFVAARRPSLVAENRTTLWLQCAGFSLSDSFSYCGADSWVHRV